MEASVELRDFLHSFYSMTSVESFALWEQHLSQHEGVLMIGTDPNDWWEGYATILETIQPQLESLAGSSCEGNLRAYVEGTVGWFADNLVWNLPNGAILPARLTGVCHKEDGDWKIVQWHLSLGVPDEQLFA